MRITLYGDPRTKKNSQRIVYVGGHPKIRPSKAYEEYEAACLWQLKHGDMISGRVNLACRFYMRTRRRVDLANLIEAVQDILVKGLVLEDDSREIIVSLDGCRVDIDRKNPRVEIEITEAEG